jgi:hypothetical protein
VAANASWVELKAFQLAFPDFKPVDELLVEGGGGGMLWPGASTGAGTERGQLPPPRHQQISINQFSLLSISQLAL